MILEAPFDPEAELARFRAGAAGAGAIASFTGVVREECEALTLERHPALSEKMLAAFAAETRARFALLDLLILHRIGRMAPTEPIVLVAAAAAHRKAALAAVDWAMDWLKSQAPFWKLEEAAGQRRWIEPRPEDYAALAAWQEKQQ